MHGVLVVGDAMLDRTIYGSVSRMAAEAPVPVLLEARVVNAPGGAANVAACVARLGTNCRLLAGIGEDVAGLDLEECFGATGASVEWLPHGFETIVKTRYYAGDRLLLRADFDRIASGHTELALASYERMIKSGHFAVVVLSDYGKGFLTPPLGQWFKIAKQHGVKVLIDPYVPSLIVRTGGKVSASRQIDLDAANELREWYSPGPDVVKLNRSELHAVAGLLECNRQDDHDIADFVRRAINANQLIVTCGDKGLNCYGPGLTHEPAYPVVVRDTQGAGDTAIAALAVSLANGATTVGSLRFMATAAALAVSKPGTASVMRAEVEAAMADDTGGTVILETLSDVSSWANRQRAAGKRVVATNGCFDLLHPGHVHTLQRTAELGSLIVGINEDKEVQRLKGEGRPVIKEDDRARMVAAIKGVDAVHIFRGQDVRSFLRAARPEVLAKGAEYARTGIVGEEVLSDWGGYGVLIPMLSEYSTTGIVGGIQNAENQR